MSISDVTKKRGRPVTTGKGTPVTVRLQPDELRELDRWIGRDDISRPAAMRMLMRSALQAEYHEQAQAELRETLR